MIRIVWHRSDLRINDHPALWEAVQSTSTICPLYIYNPHTQNPWPLKGAALWWLHHSLSDLQRQYASIGGQLIVKQGDPVEIFQKLHTDYTIEELYLIEPVDPYSKQSILSVKKWCQEHNIPIYIYKDRLVDPDAISNAEGNPYTVFTPFSKATQYHLHTTPIDKPEKIQTPSIPSDTVDDLKLMPKIPWYTTMASIWKPGRKGAEDRLERFLDKRISHYAENRDFVDKKGTSTLSPHLAFGEISCREVWHRCAQHPDSAPFLRQLLWKEFGTYFIHHFPHSVDTSWRSSFEDFQWEKDPYLLKKWQQGQTGYPIVDAAMRQLWQTGWMHNRARMIVGSFLTKDLLIHWIEGAKWFWDTLLDADLGNNTLGWQWVAGSGPDAAPYFRIFNPILQSKKFDPAGHFIRKYIPELSALPDKWIHTPWEAPDDILKKANIEIGVTYPHPIVDHQEARKKALALYEKIKKKSL